MAEENDGAAVETTRAEDIAAAFDVVEARETAAVPAAPAVATPAPAPAEAPADRTPLEGRDALGRFAPKREATDGQPAPALAPPAPAAPAAAQPPQPEVAVPPRLAKPPASWAPNEAAHWDKTPVEVREAVARREHEVQRVLQESASARQGLSQLQQVIAPYVSNIQAANGGDVVNAIRTFFDYDNRLRHGTQIEKARAATSLIRGYGIDIATLDNELAGAQHSPEQTQQAAIQAAIARETAPLRQFLAQQQRHEEEQRAALAERVDGGLQEFAADAAHPHYHAVRADMADILELATAQGRRMTLKDAYDRACWQNPEIRGILIAGQQSAAAGTQHQAAQRARAAAVGVRNAPRAGAPANVPPAAERTRAEDIAAAFAAHAGEV